MVGVIELSMRLPGATALASPPMQPEHVRRARLGAEVVHLVVQQEPGARHHLPVAVRAVQRRRRRDGVAVGVHDRVVRRLRTARSRAAGRRWTSWLGVAVSREIAVAELFA